MSSAFKAGASKRMERPFGSPRTPEASRFITKSFFLDVYFIPHEGLRRSEMEMSKILVAKIEPLKYNQEDLEVIKLEGNVVDGYGYLPSMGDHEGERPEVEILIDLRKRPFEMVWGGKHPHSGLDKKPIIRTKLYASRKGAVNLASQISDLRSYYVGDDDVFLPYRATDFQLAK